MRIISQVEAVTPKLTPPAANDAFFYTAGRMLSYNKPTKNGLVFFREDCMPVVDTLRSALSNVAHIKPGNDEAPDTYNLKNGVIGSIYDFLEHDEGIDIVCKNDKGLVQGMGFRDADFSPSGRFASYSQESEYTLADSPFISVPVKKAKEEYFTPQDIKRTYSFQEAQSMRLYPSRFDMRTQSWKFCLDPEGNAVFVRLKPSSFTGVGHVIFPADDSADIYRYTASVNQEQVDKVFGGPEKANSGLNGLDAGEPNVMDDVMSNPYLTSFQDDYIEHPELGDNAVDYSGVDLQDDFEADEDGTPSVIYIPDADDIWVNLEDLQGMRSLSKIATPYGADAKYADPGYRGDKKRYPLDTPEHIAAAARYWGQAKNKAKYSAKERAQISAKIAAAEHKHKIGQHANSAYAAVYTTPHPEKQGKFMVNRRFKMTDESGMLSRPRLISAYQALTGMRGHTAVSQNMPSMVRDHALALVRQGLKLTKNNKELSMSNVDLNPHITAELEELRERARTLSQDKDAAIAAKSAELEEVRREFSQYKETQENLIKELKDSIAEKETALSEYKSRELSQARLSALEAVHPFSEAEKSDEKFPEFVKSLSSVSDDRMETLLVRRELEKTKAERTRSLSQVAPTNPKVSPAPTFDGFAKSLQINDVTDVI